MFQDLKVATVFLTRLPVRVEGTLGMRDLGRAVHLFPIVGALVGCVGGAAFALGAALGLPATPCAILALAGTALLTGALHEDGLADTADGLGAGTDRERALAIMRDSRIGTFGTLALLLTVLARLGAVAALGEAGGAAQAVAALVAAGAGSRAAMPVVMLLQPGARATGLAAEAGRPGAVRAWGAVPVAAAVALLVLPAGAVLAAGLAAALVAGTAATALGRRLGGCTGDTLGAVQQLAEVAFLLTLQARL